MIHNHEVAGSSPALATVKKGSYENFVAAFFVSEIKKLL